MTLLLSSQTASLSRTLRIYLKFRQLLATLVIFVTITPLRADLADDYLGGLRGRGWHDTALEYLDEAAHDPISTPAFLEKLNYERATTQAALARQTANEKQGQLLLAAAAVGFRQFAAEKPTSPLQLQALATAGNLVTEQALHAMSKASKLPAAARQQREKLHDSARVLLDQAKEPLQTLLELCDAKLKALPKAAQQQKTQLQKNQSSQASRQHLHGKQAEAKFLLAKLDLEKSRTYAAESKAQQQTLKAAAAAFAKLYEEYEDKLVGFYGRFYQGRSYQSAGDFDKALECYWNIVDQPPIANMVFRRLVARSYRYRAECHFAKEDFETVINECSAWLAESRGPELSEPDWLAVSYQLAVAYEAKADSAGGNDAKKLRTDARKLYREIAKQAGEFQADAKTKMVSTGTGRDKPVLVNTFDEALIAGNDALQQMTSAKLAAKLAQENNPDSYESLNEQAISYQSAATQYFQQATQFADEQTDREQLATARYYLCWLYWKDGRLDDAAVIGQFLARRYPENKYAPVAAKLALAAYERLYNAARLAGESTDFEAQQLAAVAELLAQRWPESPEAAAGLNLLINLALRDDRLSDAEKMLERLPPSSRAGAELRLGGAVWTRYLQASRIDGGSDDAALTLKQKAGELLANGFQALQAKPQPSAAEATGVLYFAQFLLADGEAERAVTVLENSSIGPLSLIEKKSRAAERPAFVQKTYQVALRAYFSTEPPQRDNAQAMMTALESAIGSEGDAQQKLISTYVSLGLQLQQQISALTAEGQANKARAVAASFEDLLDRVTQRAGAAEDWKIQSWIAQTNLQLGQGLRGKDAARYYQQAEQAYQTLLTKADGDPKFAPSPVAILATKKRLADCLQAQQNYADAFQQYVSILRSKPNMLELQKAAASALQQWGTEKKDTKRLEESIRGAQPQSNQKNLVWGWLRLATIADQAKRKAERKAAASPGQPSLEEASTIAKYQSLFFEARYNAAQARFAAAKVATGAERTKQLRTLRHSLKLMKSLYPDLGGPQWQGSYVKLLEQMEQEK